MDTTVDLTPSEVIDRVRAVRVIAHQAAVEELELAVIWALQHPCPVETEWPAHWGDPRLDEEVTPLAGPGAPLVAEFAPADFAAALEITLDAARLLIADALELTYRLPRLWAHVRAGTVPVWRARAIAQHTHDLGVEAVAFADRLIAATPTKIRLIEARRLIDEARLYFDPDRATAEEEHQLARRGVWVKHTGHPAHPGHPATTDVIMTLDTDEALLLDQTLTRIAADLAGLGDTDPLDVRRARAVGIIADPQHALDLMSGRAEAAPSPGAGGRAINLYLHLTPDHLTPLGPRASTGAVSVEKLGTATTQLIDQWLTRHAAAGGKVILRPVLDLAEQTAVDRHDPPAPMRELCLLRDAHCVFPGCRRDSRTCDLDHITAYLPLAEGGPPGQTRPDNLAPLCRSHHRIKTHTTWNYKRRDDGHYTWTSPTGHQYDVATVSRRPPARRSQRRT